MKQTSVRPRTFFGFLPPSILLLLALVALVAFPTSSALARPKCDPVDIYYEYNGPTGLQVVMETETPPPYIIFFTTNGQNPTHTGPNPGAGTGIYSGPIPVPYGQTVCFKALCYKAYPYVDSDITSACISNPPQ